MRSLCLTCLLISSNIRITLPRKDKSKHYFARVFLYGSKFRDLEDWILTATCPIHNVVSILIFTILLEAFSNFSTIKILCISTLFWKRMQTAASMCFSISYYPYIGKRFVSIFWKSVTLPFIVSKTSTRDWMRQYFKICILHIYINLKDLCIMIQKRKKIINN